MSVVNSFDRAAKCITVDTEDSCHASVNLVYDNKGSTSFLPVDGYAEQNLIVRVGKSEAEVTNNERLRSRY